MAKTTGKKRYWVLGFFIFVFGSYFAFADMVIKSILQSQLGQSQGAEVNIGDFEHSLFPLRVEITDIEFTNPSKPSHNQIEVGTIESDLEWGPLISGRIVINQMSLLNVAFDQQRATNGEVYRKPDANSAFSWEKLVLSAKSSLPSSDELLANSPLKSTAAAQQAKQDYDTYAESLKTQYNALPDKEKIKTYQAQIKSLQDTDYKDPAALLKAKDTLQALKTAISEDRTLISNFTENAKNAQAALRESLSNLNQARKDDYALMKSLVNGDEAALNHVTQLVFGDEVAKYNQYLIGGLQFLLPMLTGENSDEAEEVVTDAIAATAPNLIVRKADVSIKWGDETFSSAWQNITDNHALLGEATTFTASALSGDIEDFAAEGKFWLDENGIDASQTWQLAGLALSNITLAQQDRLDAALKQALLSFAGSLSIEDNQLSGSSELDLKELVLSATGEDKVGQAIANVLSDLTSLTMQVNLDGSISAPGFNIKSDLDNQLAQAALAQVSASQQEKLDELQQKLQAKVGTEQNLLNGQLANIDTWLSAAQGDSAQLQNLLKAELSNVLDQKKQSIIDKLKGKLNDF